MNRFGITALLAGLGGVFGAVAGIALTFLGNVISGYSVPPGVDIYATNAGILAAIGAVGGPVAAWTLLRRVPLWRAVAEPAGAALLAGVGAMVLAPGLFLPAVVVVGVTAAVRLHFAFAGEEGTPPLESGNDTRGLPPHTS